MQSFAASTRGLSQEAAFSARLKQVREVLSTFGPLGTDVASNKVFMIERVKPMERELDSLIAQKYFCSDAFGKMFVTCSSVAQRCLRERRPYGNAMQMVRKESEE